MDRRQEEDSCIREFEALIAGAMVDVATEIRLTDPCELILMIRGDHAANIADLVNSSTELFFKSGTVRYALSAACRVHWNAAPEIGLEMEFRHDNVCAFFRLLIGRRKAGVQLIDVLFDEAGLDAGARSERLAAAIADAKLPRH